MSNDMAALRSIQPRTGECMPTDYLYISSIWTDTLKIDLQGTNILFPELKSPLVRQFSLLYTFM